MVNFSNFLPPTILIQGIELLLKYGANVNEVDADGCHFFQHLITELRESPTEDILKFTIHVLQVRNRQPTATIFMMHKDAFGKALFSYLWRLPGFAGYTIRTQFEFGRQLLDWRESTSDEEKSLLTTRDRVAKWFFRIVGFSKTTPVFDSDFE